MYAYEVSKADKELMKKLSAPFKFKDVKFYPLSISKSQSPMGLVAFYIDARAIFDRFDEVFGLSWNSHVVESKNGFMATITVNLPDGRVVSRTDGAEGTEIESYKGGISTAIRRAAVHFGVGRYLYDEQFKNIWFPIVINGRTKYFDKKNKKGATMEDIYNFCVKKRFGQ